MNTNDKTPPTVNPDGAVEVDEAQLQEVAAGAGDYLPMLGGIQGESDDRSSPGGVNVAFGDGSVRFLR